MVLEKRQGDFTISTDPALLDIKVVHGFLTRSYWARGIPRDVVERAIANSLCFGLYEGRKQIGFARVVTDYARIAHLLDVFVLEEHRGHGLGKWLVGCVMEHLETFGLFKIALNTRDAHGLYRRFGFKEIGNPQTAMEVVYDVPWWKKE